MTVKAPTPRPTNPLIVALDVATMADAMAWVTRLAGHVSLFKVGMQLFYREGPVVVREIQATGSAVFLDLKLYDIPHTVARACDSVTALGARFLTVHASGGLAMLQAAQAAVQGSNTHLLGVTALTSFDTATLQGVYPEFSGTPSTWGQQLAGLVAEAGLHGLVCSGQENARFRALLGADRCLVNPGIRLPGEACHDQQRVVTSTEALASGAHYLVVGRPILEAPDPLHVVAQLLEPCDVDLDLPR